MEHGRTRYAKPQQAYELGKGCKLFERNTKRLKGNDQITQMRVPKMPSTEQAARHRSMLRPQTHQARFLAEASEQERWVAHKRVNIPILDLGLAHTLHDAPRISTTVLRRRFEHVPAVVA